MGAGENVLWHLRPCAPTDGAYHRGADIALLSQFSNEAEVCRARIAQHSTARAASARLPAVATAATCSE